MLKFPARKKGTDLDFHKIEEPRSLRSATKPRDGLDKEVVDKSEGTIGE
jgi:hypothetical protein